MSGNGPANANPQTANRGPGEMGAPAAGHPSGGPEQATNPTHRRIVRLMRIRRWQTAAHARWALPPRASSGGWRPDQPTTPKRRLRRLCAINPSRRPAKPVRTEGFAKAPAPGLNKTAFARIAPGGEAIAASARGRASLGHAPRRLVRRPSTPRRDPRRLHIRPRPMPPRDPHPAAAAPHRPRGPHPLHRAAAPHKH